MIGFFESRGLPDRLYRLAAIGYEAGPAFEVLIMDINGAARRSAVVFHKTVRGAELLVQHLTARLVQPQCTVIDATINPQFVRELAISEGFNAFEVLEESKTWDGYPFSEPEPLRPLTSQRGVAFDALEPEFFKLSRPGAEKLLQRARTEFEIPPGVPGCAIAVMLQMCGLLEMPTDDKNFAAEPFSAVGNAGPT